MTNRKRIIALSLLLLMGAAILGGCGGKKAQLDGTVATVNGYEITGDALMERLKIFQLFFQQPMDDAETKTAILDQLVRERLIIAEAEANGITVDQARVESEMVQFYGALERQYNSRAQLESTLSELGLTNEQISSFLKAFLLANAAVEKQKAAVDVADEEVRTFYEEKKDTLYTFQADVVRASHILLPPDQAEKAKDVAAKARGGDDFAALAKEYSTDPGSAQQGGELGYFAQAGMVAEFASAAFAMQPGEISDPVQTEYGWHVIKLADRKGPGALSFEEAASDIRNRLLPQKQDQAVDDWVRTLEQRATISKSEIRS